MMTTTAVLLLASLSASAETRWPAFGFTDAGRIRAQKIVMAAPAPRAADVISSHHMLIRAGKDALFGHVRTPAEFQEASAYWSDVLRSAGIEPGTPILKEGLYVLPYRTRDGRVLRDFLAEPRQFPPKDETGLRENMALARQALSKAGLDPVAARVAAVEHMLPTYSILYLAKPEGAHERETLLRVLNPGDDLDPALITLAPVTVVQQPEPWILVYIGPELGYVGLIGRTPEELAVRLERRKASLVAMGKRIIAEKPFALDDEEYKFGVDLLFFQ